MDNFSSTRIAVPKQELRLLGLISVPIQQYCLKRQGTMEIPQFFSNNSPHYQGKKHISEGISNMVDIEIYSQRISRR